MKSQNLPGASFNTRFSFAQHTENVNLKQKKKKVTSVVGGLEKVFRGIIDQTMGELCLVN